MDRSDIWMAEVIRLQKENEQLKLANRELLECVQEMQEEIELLKNGPIRSGTF
jgi:hypothetical protein